MDIKIKDLMDAFDKINSDTEAYYHISDGKIHFAKISERVNLEHYIAFPSDKDINEYNIMRYFIYSLEDEAIQDNLFAAIRGDGAFRRFKDAIHELKLTNKWYKYRRSELEIIAREWCDENEIRVME